MLSRVADTIYWMARYLERSTSILQVIRTNYISSQDEINEFSWRSVLQTYGTLSLEEMEVTEKNTRAVLYYLLLDKENVASVYNNISRSRENARAIQDHITKEVWQTLNASYHFIRLPEIEQNILTGDPVSALDLLIKQNLLYTGTADTTMPRGEGFNYMNIGKFLERAIQSTDILSIKIREMDYLLVDHSEDPQWRYLLYSLLGYSLYLKTYKGNLQAENVINFILYNANFPHSILYSLQQLNKYSERLKEESLPESFDHLEFLIGRLVNNVKYSTISPTDGKACYDFLTQIRNGLFEIAGTLSQKYFGITNQVK